MYFLRLPRLRGQERTNERLQMYGRLPKLVYDPYVWGAADKAIWKAMKHTGKFPRP